MAQLAHLEQTIAAPLEFSGVGLHSGAPVTMRLLPAPAGSGIVFRRTDLDNFEIPATGRNVAKVSYATSLMRQGVLISTTEHLLSAFIGMGVDNVIVEIDNLELPILDGSALPYVEAFLRVGIREQRRRRETLRVLQPVEVREGDKFIGVYPGTGYRISYTIDFPAPIGQQKTLRGPGSGDVWIGDCAGAHLWLQGRRKQAARHGADSRRGPGERHHSGPKRPGERPAALSRRVCAAQGAGPDRRPGAGRAAHGGARGGERAGHAMHTALVSRLMKDRSAWELAHVPVTPPETTEPQSEADSGLAQAALAGA